MNFGESIYWLLDLDQEAMKSVRITHSSDDDNSESDSLKSSTIISEIPKKKATTTRANTIAHGTLQT